ncbi:MAG: hypothetical protein AB1774_07280 [Bacillota bacterium]
MRSPGFRVLMVVLMTTAITMAPNKAIAITAPQGETLDPAQGQMGIGDILVEPCPACVATINRATQEGRVDEALAWIYKLFLRIAPGFVPERFRCLEHRMEQVVTVAEIRENMDRLVSKEVKVRGAYMGWSGKVGKEAGTPVTRSDWLLKDETGWIYVTGGAIPGLSPWRKADQGRRIEVVGVARAKADGIPCLEFKEGRVLGEAGPAGGSQPSA